jgi:hypothetical protein
MNITKAKQEAESYFKRGENCNCGFNVNQKSLVYDFLYTLYDRGFTLEGKDRFLVKKRKTNDKLEKQLNKKNKAFSGMKIVKK